MVTNQFLTTLVGSLCPGRYFTFSCSVLMISVNLRPFTISSNTHIFTVLSKVEFWAVLFPTILAMAEPLQSQEVRGQQQLCIKYDESHTLICQHHLTLSSVSYSRYCCQRPKIVWRVFVSYLQVLLKPAALTSQLLLLHLTRETCARTLNFLFTR